MNCIEALNEQCRVCKPCRINSFIVEFEELPEKEKYNFDWYEKQKHMIMFCKECFIYNLLGD